VGQSPHYIENKIHVDHDALLGKGNGNVAGSVPADPNGEKFLPCVPDNQADVLAPITNFSKYKVIEIS
jgi:hypothetical protein